MSENIKRLFIAAILVTFAAGDGFAQTDQLRDQDYRRAERFLSWNLSDKVFKDRVNPHWIDRATFWYSVQTRRGTEYMLVDAERREKNHAFDHDRLAGSLAEAAGEEISAWEMSLGGLQFSENLTRIRFDYNDGRWQCSLQNYQCEELDDYSVPDSVISPDGSKAVYQKDHNLWLRDLETGEDLQLTSEGEEHYGFGTNNQGWSRSDRPIVSWSPDSRKITTFRLDEREVGSMVLWSMQEGRPEPDIWPYALPGDEIVPMLERVVINVEEPSVVWLDMEPDHQRASNCCGLIRNGELADVEWSTDSNSLAIASTSRDYKDVTLRVADPATGDVREIYSDREEPFFESNLTSRGIPNWRVLHDSNEFIWFNRQDNYGHLYLHDLETGELKNRITEGEWNVVDILHIDETDRTIFFTGVAREEGRDPHLEHLYKINFDGSGLTLLTPEDANHNFSVGPDASFFVDTYSDFVTAPVTVLRDSDGNRLMALEEADISDLLATGWRKPIPFSVKARDGETDLYGIMMLPSDFNPNQKYPIINAIYPGPQGGSVGSRSFSYSRRGQAHALAELGFVVVAIDALGSSPIRSKDFHAAYHGDMSDNGLPDHITGMQQLAEEYSFIDLSRVGIYGHSGGGFATAAALLQHPDFFKVGVSGAGNHDNRGYTYYWGEKYQGQLEESETGDNFRNQANHLKAENLEGKLLISYGTMDTNVHPSMTQLLVNELIAHNKDFDLLVMPNRGHGYANEPYSIRKTWDYFVEHLMRKIPPKEYNLSR